MVSANKHDLLASAQNTASAASSTRRPSAADTRKRKRGEDGPADPTQKLITIRPCPSSPYDKPISLAHVKLIDRAQLPLSFLDSVTASSPIPSTRLFSAYIETLERQDSEDVDSSAAPRLLVARLDADGSLYAIERVQYGIYALCKLGAWVKEADIIATVNSPQGLPYAHPIKALKREDGRPWWQPAVLPIPQGATPIRTGGQMPRISMRRPLPKITTGASQSHDDIDPFVDTGPQQPTREQPHMDGLEALQERPQTAEEVFQALVQQYLEALYLSKTSLAFFVKGPMSRSRAAFASQSNPDLKMGDLAAFMRSILLQPGPMDKKHREKLPEVIKSMPLPGLSDDEDMAQVKPEKKKKTRSKRLKPNKEGLYPNEDDYVKKWWLQDQPGSPQGHGESAADILKRRLGDLRVRESMAQIILVLEILALEASSSFQAADQDETLHDETQAESQPAKKRKAKKPQDLNVLLDLLLDRLCIWQSVEEDETLVKVSKSGSKNNALTPNSTKPGTSDKLKNFCVEVILPFYMSRFPEKAAAINKRLGGPSASPAKPSGHGSSTSRSKPGEAAVRTDPRSAQRRRRPLQRVATENAAHQPQRQPSLSRSSTDSLLPINLKREGSEAPSLSSIPVKDSQTSSSRNSLSQFERFAKRQIDLDAMSKTNEARLKKKAHIEQELEKAIGTLRKPNRGEALKELADSADATRKHPSARKPASSSTHAARKPANTVLVGATPKRGRKTKEVAVHATPKMPASAAPPQPFDDYSYYSNAVPPSSDPVIPSSAIRPQPGSVVPGSVIKSSAATAIRDGAGRGRGAAAVEETPSRGPAGKTVHFFFPPTSVERGGVVSGAGGARGGSGVDGAGAGDVAATPTPPVSKLAEKLKAREHAGGGSSNNSKFLAPPPAFKLPAAPSMSALRGRRSGLSDDEDEDEYDGVAAMLSTPTKAKAKAGPGPGPAATGAVFETPVKAASSAGLETVDELAGDEGGVPQQQNKGKERATGVEEGGENEVSIYDALGWDDDIDELA